MSHPIPFQEWTCWSSCWEYFQLQPSAVKLLRDWQPQRNSLTRVNDLLRAACTQWPTEVEIQTQPCQATRQFWKIMLVPEVPIRSTNCHQIYTKLYLSSTRSCFLSCFSTVLAIPSIDSLHTKLCLWVCFPGNQNCRKGKYFPIGRASHVHPLYIEKNGPKLKYI